MVVTKPSNIFTLKWVLQRRRLITIAITICMCYLIYQLFSLKQLNKQFNKDKMTAQLNGFKFGRNSPNGKKEDALMGDDDEMMQNRDGDGHGHEEEKEEIEMDNKLDNRVNNMKEKWDRFEKNIIDDEQDEDNNDIKKVKESAPHVVHLGNKHNDNHLIVDSHFDQLDPIPNIKEDITFEPVLGVKKSLHHLYRSPKTQPSNNTFHCFMSGESISYAQVNDDYCDCDDGTDEPSTSACPKNRFHCTKDESDSHSIPSSRVNDGICDCCDGSDEYLNLGPPLILSASQIEVIKSSASLTKHPPCPVEC